MQSRETRFILRIESGEREGEQVPLAEGVLQVGRRPECGLILKDGSVSGKHAELRVAGERVELVDLGSTNGTRVSGRKIEQTVLSHGDALLFGNVRATLHDVRFAGEAAPARMASPAGDAAAPEAGAIGHVSAEKVTRSAAGSKRSLVWIVVLLLLGGGAYAYLKLLAPKQQGGTARASVPSVPGNLIQDGSFEEASAAWTAAESAPIAFLSERGFAHSGELGFGVHLEEGGWSMASSPEITLHARRALSTGAFLRVEDAAEGRYGVQLSSASGALPSFVAWAPARRAAGAFEELELAFDAPGGYDRARLVVFGRGRGAVALDDAHALEQEPLARATKFNEYELSVLGQPGSTAVLARSGQALLTGFDLSSLGKEGLAGWASAELAAEAQPHGFRLAFAGAPRESSLAFTALRAGDAGESAWVATTGPEGYAAYGGDFTRASVMSLLLGSGTELVRLGFARPVAVTATAVAGGMQFRAALEGLTEIAVQLAFQEERAGAATLADRARDAERKKDLGPALAGWTELLDRFPFERKLVTEATEARARLVQDGLNQVDALRREMERARFFLLPELFQKGAVRAGELAAQYRGSEVEREALKVVEQCRMALTELTAGDQSGDTQRLQAVIQALSAEGAPSLTELVREALAGGAVHQPGKGD